ncbi:MAG: hypothetical protein M1837_007365 [Sclerophora amabilis]|nr:MAG: hypothetical protein M1837_007365 [Sclerophora amabilis]
MQSLGFKNTRLGQSFVCHACRSALTGFSQIPRNPFSSISPRCQERTARQGRQTLRGRRVRQRKADVGSTQPAADKPKINIQGDQEASELKARIDKLEEELQQMRRGGLLANKEFLAELSDEDRKSVVKTLQDGAQSNADGVGRSKLHRPADQSASTVRIMAPKEQRIYLNRLNGYLKQAEVGVLDQETRRQLWRWYIRCKQSVPAFVFRIPQEAWDILWETQSVVSPHNPDRSTHMKTIAKDIVSLGRELTPPQKMAYIEALFLDGEHDTAIKEWEASEASLGASDDVSKEFMSLGVRLFAAHNDPARAQKVAYVLLDANRGEEARILIPVIFAWVRMGDLPGFQEAWSLYVRMKVQLAEKMTMQDYDAVTQSFLEAGRADLALGVFKDMMLSRDPSSDYASPKIYRRAVGKIIEMQSMTLSASETHKISLEAMTVLPRRFQNKFFYGSWIKKLLGAGEPDSAAAVVELMFKRGVQPDPKFLNGIIGAWIRTGDARAFDRAEKMSWDMIEQRKVFAFERRQTTRGEEPHRDPEVVQIKDGRYHSKRIRSVPSATIETFCILIEYYLRRDNTGQIHWLNRSLGLAEVPPNTFFFNHLLKSHLKSDGLREVWNNYSTWAKKTHLTARPDLDTYEFLWECEKLRLDKTPQEWFQRSPSAIDTPKALADSGSVAASELNGSSAIDTPKVLADSGSVADSELEGSSRESSVMSFEERKALVRRSTGFPAPRALFADMTSWAHSQSPKQLANHAASFTKLFYDFIIRCFICDNSNATSGGDLAGALVAMHALKSFFKLYPDEATARLIILHVSRNTTTNAAGGDEVRRRREGRYNVRKVSGLLEKLAEQRAEYLAQQQHLQRQQQQPREQQQRPTRSEKRKQQDAVAAAAAGTKEEDNPELLRKEENLFLMSELLRTVLAQRLRPGGADVDTVIQRAAWDMGVGGIRTGE